MSVLNYTFDAPLVVKPKLTLADVNPGQYLFFAEDSEETKVLYFMCQKSLNSNWSKQNMCKVLNCKNGLMYEFASEKSVSERFNGVVKLTKVV